MEGMLSVSLRRVCRVCLAAVPASACRSLDVWSSSGVMRQFLADLTALQVQEDDGLPTGLCSKCSEKVLEAYALRQLAQQSDVKLRETINKRKESETITKTDPISEHEGAGRGKGGKKYKCQKCSKQFKFLSALVRHEETHDPRYKCTVCEKVFAFRSSFQRHSLQHTRTGQVQCAQCDSYFLDDVLLRRHINYAHKQKNYCCDVCGSKFGTAAALKSHRKSHIEPSERALRCRHDGCHKSFNFPHHLKHHEMTHTGKKQYFCDECGKGFVQSHHLSAHIVKHRTNARPRCHAPSCEETLPNQYALKWQSAVHEKATPTESATCSCDGSCITKLNDISQKKTQSTEHVKEASKITNTKLKNPLNNIQLNIVSTKFPENTVQEINANDLYQDWHEKSNERSTPNITGQLEKRRHEPVMDIEEMVTKTCGQSAPKNNSNLCFSTSKATTARSQSVLPMEDKLDGNDCKGFFGKCIVGSSADGANSEDCICAKVNYEMPMPEYLTAPLLTALEQQGYYPS